MPPGETGEANLILDEDSAEAIEKLEGCNDTALHQHRYSHCCRCPPPRADRHLVEPLLKRELTDDTAAACAKIVHVHDA